MNKLAIVLAASLSAATAHAAEDCQLKQTASVEMETLPDGYIAVPVKIAGADQKLLLALDVPHSAVSGDYADGQKLETKRIRWNPQTNGIVTIGISYMGQKVEYAATLQDFRIGMVHAPQFDVLRVSGYPWNEPGLVGVLGLDILSNFDVELDFRENKLNLYSSDHCKGQVVYWADTYAAVPFQKDELGQITFDMTLDGKQVRATFGTTSQSSQMSMAAAKKLFGIDAGSPDLTPLPPHDGHAVFDYPFKSLSVEGIAINNPAIHLIETDDKFPCDDRIHDTAGKSIKCYGGHDLKIGLKELRALRPYFAFKEKMLYVTAADAHK